MDCMPSVVILAVALAGSPLTAARAVCGLIPMFVRLVSDIREYSSASAEFGFGLFPVFSHWWFLVRALVRGCVFLS